MTNLEVALLTFIFTLIFAACGSPNFYSINKDTIKKCKYISFPDGSTWKKIEEYNNGTNP